MKAGEFYKIIFFYFVFFLLFFDSSMAQKRANIWYFGVNAGLDFTSGSPVALTNGKINTSEGCSSICDNNGNLLFYTDGVTIYNASHTIMTNGAGLKGDNSSTQSALIVPKPGSTTLYYVFTPGVDGNGGANGLRYSIVDMSVGSGIVTATKNILLFAPVSEQLAAVMHNNCTDVWIMAHDTSGNGYYAYLLTSAGITGPVISPNTGAPVHNVTAGQLKFSPNGQKLAFANWRSGVVEMADFNNITGTVSGQFTIYTGIPYFTYGVSFSPNSSLLYTSGRNAFDYIYQFDLLAGNTATIIASKTALGWNGLNSSLQIGPDKKIYVSQQGNTYVGVINNPNVVGVGCNFVNNAVLLSGKMCLYGLNNLIESYFSETITCPWNVSVLQTDVSCYGRGDGSATVSVSGGNSPYTYLWNPGDQTTQTVTGLSAGNYTVTVTDAVNASFTQTVSIVQPAPISITISSNPTVIIIGQSTALTAGGGATYQWTPSTSLSCSTCANPVATPSVTTTYCVLVTDGNSCSDSTCITITVDVPCGTLFIPTAFSPNDDGENDAACVLGGCIKLFHLTIYDRWGEKVFETTDSDKDRCWNGIYKGKPLASDVFCYSLQATFTDESEISQKGNISLLK